MERNRPPAQLTAEETQQVLKRASQLERRDLDAVEPSLDLAEVERIGVEAGLSRETIQRAFVELRAGALRDKPKTGAADALIGPGVVEAQRAVALPPEDARRKLHAVLKDELLHPEERQGNRTVWSPTPGLWAAIQRGFNWQGQSAWSAGSILSEVAEAPAGTDAHSVVRLEARLGGRTRQIIGIVAPGLSMLPVAVASIFANQAPAGLPFVIGGTGLFISAVVLAITRTVHHGKLRKLRMAIERVLEKVSGEHEDL
jgi:hypothetical protein